LGALPYISAERDPTLRKVLPLDEKRTLSAGTLPGYRGKNKKVHSLTDCKKERRKRRRRDKASAGEKTTGGDIQHTLVNEGGEFS